MNALQTFKLFDYLLKHIFDIELVKEYLFYFYAFFVVYAVWRLGPWQRL